MFVESLCLLTKIAIIIKVLRILNNYELNAFVLNLRTDINLPIVKLNAMRNLVKYCAFKAVL